LNRRAADATIAGVEHRNTIASAGSPARPAALQAIAWLLVAALFCGGLPMLTGVVVIADSKPAFTLDVCHPLNAASYNLSPSTAPLVPMHAAAQPLADWGMAREFVALLPPGAARAPDPPPPKLA
jgi:hypothetical protein